MTIVTNINPSYALRLIFGITTFFRNGRFHALRHALGQIPQDVYIGMAYHGSLRRLL